MNGTKGVGYVCTGAQTHPYCACTAFMLFQQSCSVLSTLNNAVFEWAVEFSLLAVILLVTSPLLGWCGTAVFCLPLG